MIESFFLFLLPQSSYPIWEDFITKAGKLQSQLRWEHVFVHVYVCFYVFLLIEVDIA